MFPAGSPRFSALLVFAVLAIDRARSHSPVGSISASSGIGWPLCNGRRTDVISTFSCNAELHETNHKYIVQNVLHLKG